MASLNRRQTELEDAELELMEQRETAQATLDDVAARLTAAGERRAEAEARRDAALAEIDQGRGVQDRRADAARRRPAGRPGHALRQDPRGVGGLGAALLRAGRCGGCRLELSGTDRARVKAAPPDEVVRCEECRRIMVRTAESGL